MTGHYDKHYRGLFGRDPERLARAFDDCAKAIEEAEPKPQFTVRHGKRREIRRNEQ